ncbi:MULTISPECIES: DsbA family oxidoreductase [unclassified Sphingomonas]|uniref:DsbA family oxidoreductase n=1 Tax=unclassified Sphingomonas TaxID=196159 RepID=UPI000E74D4FD|nr:MULTISPECIES: DsbA family oxidoreductase [unclassified Sphingomonas]RKE42348.1 putative DsbA family dithiol-disulfide isomerase [Sphingomonas sp. PP-CC-1A-547]TCM03554.1 putative DsbA family dithiol-disulfide isomerase [Sphingomonas sp. PP-CC-3G-468]
MIAHLKIDFVSDVACPWCIIGLRALEEALAQSADALDAEIAFQPFELNPTMPFGGQNIGEHVAQKYGSTREQSAANRAMIVDRAAELGFTMAMTDDSRIYNTFDAHRLLHWAGIEGRQSELKHALFDANFTDNADPGDHQVLVAAAAKAGLDPVTAGEVLNSGRYADEVLQAEEYWRGRGINAVPAIVINGKHLISGGQPVAVFEPACGRSRAQLVQAVSQVSGLAIVPCIDRPVA